METVEQTLPTRPRPIKRDLCGVWDLIAFPTTDSLRDTFMLIQVTSGANHAARRTKIANEPRVQWCRMAGAILELHSWRRNAAGQWICKREDLS